MIQEAYEKARKEHPLLPAFDIFDKEFEIARIENPDFILKDVKQQMAEKFQPILDLFEHIISPDPSSLADVYECRAFTNGEKKQIIELFRKIMENYRLMTELDMMCDDKADADAIRKISDLWQEQKKQVIPLIKKLRIGWQKQVEPTEILDYMG